MISKLSLGDQIKKLRKLNKLTQEKLAEIVDITPRQLVRLESAKGYPSIETLWELSKAFNVDISSFFGEYKIDDESAVLKKDINELLSTASRRELILIKKLIETVLNVKNDY